MVDTAMLPSEVLSLKCKFFKFLESSENQRIFVLWVKSTSLDALAIISDPA
jgi:hypothetical protein